MENKNKFYSKSYIYKPWGYEYIIYDDKNKIGVTFLKVDYNHSTSLHCHPTKKTGFIILNGKADVQIGIYKNNRKKFNSLSRLVFRPGLFHSLKALSKSGLYALEFESPYDKNDLIRFKDNYGRKSKEYEGKKFAKNLDQRFLKFKKPIVGRKNMYFFNNLKITIENTKNLKNFSSKDHRSSVAILDGKIIDKRGKSVISFGEIVKTSTLKILSQSFKIMKPLTVLQVKKFKSKKKNNFKIDHES